jgi:AcrR family transcriptional regulator
MAKTKAQYPRGSSPARLSLQARKQEFARDAIWDAAIDLFAEKGFDETTVDEIVERAGTSRRSFFRHFESKSDLMARPVMLWGESMVRAVEESKASLPPAQLLREVIFAILAEFRSSDRVRKLMQIAEEYPAARDAQLSRTATVQHRLAEAFMQRCKDKTMAQLLAGLTFTVLSTTYRSWFESGDKDIAVSTQRVLKILEKTVCVAEGEARRVAGRGRKG